MEPFFLKNELYYLIRGWDSKSLVAGFTTKNGGESQGSFSTLNVGFHVHDNLSNVCQNRKKLSGLINFPLETWVGAEQTHGNKIAKIDYDDRGKGASAYEDSFKDTDGFFTKEKGVLLTLCYADCVPIYFLAPKEEAVGLAHAGWKGSVTGIAEEMIHVFQEENIHPRDILVVIGPSICENCYIVDERVIKSVQNILEDVEEKPYNLINGDQYHLNLKELNRQIILRAGVPEENIFVTKLCTSCNQQFFSHRRDNGKTGRMMSFIGWKED